MKNFVGTVFCMVTICLLGFANSKNPKEMNEQERKKFARDLLSQVFVTTTSSTGAEFTQFGELTLDDLTENLKAYQRLHSIPVTGKVDDRTIEEMLLFRCGVKDMKEKTQNMKRRKRYAVANTKWDNSSPLTYWFTKYSSKLPEEDQRRVFAKAFKLWSDVANIDFMEGSERNKDIEILFARREHGDGPQSSFDGPGHVLAHAYFPSTAELGGDAHFDEDEEWTDRTYKGINLLQVVVHELGHSLGLGHSSVRSAIMFPSYTGYQPDVKLDYDDILGIQKLYGSKPSSKSTTTTRVSTTTTTTTTTQRPTTTTPRQRSTTQPRVTTTSPPTTWGNNRTKFCADGRFDAITSFLGTTYVFKDDMYAVLDYGKLADGYPRHILEKFQGLEGIHKIDAALSWDKHKHPRLYLFSGDRYWRYDQTGLRPGYPKKIRYGFPGLPSNIDSAFVWGRNGRTYIFKDQQYYRLTGAGDKTSGTVSYGYPRLASAWQVNSVFNKIDAAFTWPSNGRTYMFNGDQYIRFDDYNIGVDESSVPYPRKTKDWWLKCEIQASQDLVLSEINDARSSDDFIAVIPQADNEDNLISCSSLLTPSILFAMIMFMILSFLW